MDNYISLIQSKHVKHKKYYMIKYLFASAYLSLDISNFRVNLSIRLQNKLE